MKSSANHLFDQLSAMTEEEFRSWFATSDATEGLHLDHKTASLEGNHRDSLKKNLAKALSGFANSDGGVLILGTDYRDSGNRREIFGVENLSGTREYILSYLSQAVTPPVEDVAINSVTLGTEIGIILLVIPKSNHIPHKGNANGAKNYYVRIGESFVEADHYLIEYMFGSRGAPDLSLNHKTTIVKIGNSSPPTYRAKIELFAQNLGRAICIYPGIDIMYKYACGYTTDDLWASRSFELTRIPLSGDYDMKLELRPRPEQVIYPGSELFLTRFQKGFDDEETHDGLRNLEFTYSLFGKGMQSKIGLHYQVLGSQIAKLRR